MRTRRNVRGPRPTVEAMEGRLLMAAPVLDSIIDQNVPAGKSVIVPVTASDADGNALSYTVTSNNPKVTVDTKADGPFVQLNVTNYGTMTFELFPGYAPNTVNSFLGLVNRGFYNNLTFHRVVPNFVIQGGDPNGDGTGGPGYSFADEFNPNAIFTGNGQLAMANSGKDTNGSQFFVTIGQQRGLDFNHTIFGQLVRSSPTDVLTTISNVPTGTNNRPTTNVVISSATLVTDKTDAVLNIHAAADAGPATITVKVDDGHGGTDTRTFQVNTVADTTNDPPILGAVPALVKTAVGRPIDVTLSSTDLEGDPVEYSAIVTDTTAHATVTTNGNVVTITPDADYIGDIHLLARVNQQGATDRGSTVGNPYDTQAFTVRVLNQSLNVQGSFIQAVAGRSFTDKTVATLTPAAPGTASDYTVSINWGDGSQPTSGTLTPDGNGGYIIKGSHTYDLRGSNTVTVTVQDTANNVGAMGTTTAYAVAPAAAPGDYNGDGKADLAVYRPSTGQWFLKTSDGKGQAVSFGQPNEDIPLQGDFDGDGKQDLAVFRPSTAQWFITYSGGGGTVVQFGQANGDEPVPADYDGDGKTDIAVYRPSTAQWGILQSSGGSRLLQFGQANVDQPVRGDFDGDGKADLAVFRPNTATWYIFQSSAGGKVVQFGQGNSDKAIPADFDGDGRTDLAVFRPGSATWYILQSQAGGKVVQFGQPNLDVPVPNDFDGDGKADLAVYRPNTANWIVLQSGGGSQNVQFGAPNTDVAVTVPLAYRYNSTRNRL